MITCIQAIEGKMRESEAFDGRPSSVESAGRSLSAHLKAGVTPSMSVGSDHIVSGMLMRSIAIPISEVALNYLTSTSSASKESQSNQSISSAPNTAATQPSKWEELWCELRTTPDGRATISCYSWEAAISRFKMLGSELG